MSDSVACDMSALSTREDCLVLHCEPSGRCLTYSLRGLATLTDVVVAF